MPLIRYDIGDTAVLGPRSCACGSSLPTLANLTGRKTEQLIARNGGKLSGIYCCALLMGQDWIKSFSVLQEDYDHIIISVVPKNSDLDLVGKSYI
jgi:phenylacetate-CoA ligase